MRGQWRSQGWEWLGTGPLMDGITMVNIMMTHSDKLITFSLLVSPVL